MGKSAVLSGLLHLAVVLLAVFGLPWLRETNEVLQATPVSVISEAQFAELKNQKPPAQQKKKPEPPKDQAIPPAPKAPDVAQPEPEPDEPAPPEPAPAPEPVAQPEPPPEPPQAEQQQPAVQSEPPPEPPQQQVVAPEPQPEPKPQPVPPPEPQVAEAQPKPVPPKKPDSPKKKEDPKKNEKDKPKEDQVAADDTSSFLKDIEKKLKKNQKKSQPQVQQQAALPQDNYDGPPISEGEKDMIRQQVQGNWIIDIGMQGLADMTVEVKVRMNPDGSVQSAKADPNSSNGHPNWPIFAHSCENAVLKSSPLRMPPDKPYQAWSTMTLVFNAREMLGN